MSSSDWQDCYRIMDGYLFVVNKFVEVDDMGTTYTIPKNYYRRIDQKAKGKLWILTRPVKRYGGYKNYELLEPNEENGEFPVGTVFYNEKPVRKTDNPHAYDCFVKASWNCLHNYLEDWEMISEQIQKIAKKYLEEKSAVNYPVKEDEFIEIPYEDLMEWCEEIEMVCCVGNDDEKDMRGK